MNTRTVSFPSDLSDQALLDALPRLVRGESAVTAELVAHLAEADARRLYRDQAFPSMHQYCVEGLHLADGAAYKRITAGRAARRFPAILDLLADGRLHLSAVCQLAPHLTDDNHASLLEAAVYRSKREIELLLAERFPRPDVPPSLRKLPTAQAPAGAASASPAPAAIPTASSPAPTGAAQTQQPTAAPALAAPQAASPPAPSPVPPPPSRPAALVVPLSPERFKLQLTISRQTRDRLEEARDLLGHQVPSFDLAAVLDRALEVLVRELRKRKFAETDSPREPRPAHDPHYIPAYVRRAVARRDGHQCTFVSKDGRRCPARRTLEFHHLDPAGKGGEATVESVTLRCRVHNLQAAEQDYGAAHVARRIAEAHAQRAAPAPSSEQAGTLGLFDRLQ